MNNPSSSTYQPDVSLLGKVQRRLTQWRTAQPMRKGPSKTIVTFTFDDFPRSAAENGAKLLEDAGAKGTFYACSSMMDQTNIMGDLFTKEDLLSLYKSGHEIGAHTHSHLDCAQADSSIALDDIDTNLAALKELGIISEITQFAYPYGETQRRLKVALKNRFQTARGVLAGQNKQGSDLMQLRSYELDNNPANAQRALHAIKTSVDTPSWIIIFTHDVRNEHSPFGTSPATLQSLINAAQEIDADILTMGEAYSKIESA